MRDEEKHEWDRKPHETSRSYELFCVYRDQGPERSFAKARESTSGMPSLPRLKVLSVRWNWVDRARKYDDYLEHQDRLQQEKERREMRKRHAKMGVLAQNIAVEGLKNLLAKVQGGEQGISPADLTRLLEAGIKAERSSRGDPTDSYEILGPGGGALELKVTTKEQRVEEVVRWLIEMGHNKIEAQELAEKLVK